MEEAKAAGRGEQDFSVVTTELTGNGRVQRLHYAQAQPAPPFGPVEGTEDAIDADLVLLAMGFLHPQHDGAVDQLQVEKDPRGNVLFAYDVVARRAVGLKDTFVVQIRPAGTYTSGMARTVSAVRDFPAVKLGEAVKVDILQNPTTGEKIYDVLRPSDDPPPASSNTTAVGDEGGFAPALESHEQALDLLEEAIRSVGLEPGRDIALALDCAASELADGDGYVFRKAGGPRRSAAA